MKLITVKMAALDFKIKKRWLYLKTMAHKLQKLPIYNFQVCKISKVNADLPNGMQLPLISRY